MPMTRDRPKRRHCHRPRRQSRERYEAAMRSKHLQTIDWDLGCHRSLTKADVFLPPHPRSAETQKKSSNSRRLLPTRLCRLRRESVRPNHQNHGKQQKIQYDKKKKKMEEPIKPKVASVLVPVHGNDDWASSTMDISIE
jgi:hypothetical protein